MIREGISFSEKRRQRMKDGMFEDIFEENLHIAGLAPKKPSSRKRKLVLLKGTIFLTAIFSYSLLRESDPAAPRPHSPVPALELLSVEFSLGGNADSRPFAAGEGQRAALAEYNRFLNQSPVPLRNLFGLKVKTIVIDPGHGGEDPGTSGREGTKEKDITLDIATRLSRRLSIRPDYRILLTRPADEAMPLEARIGFANSQHADLYIALHVNYIPSKPYSIIETYYFGPTADRGALLLAEQENRGSRLAMGEFRILIQKISNTIKFQESRLLARSIQRSLYGNISRQNGNIFDYGVKQAPFVVLLGMDMASVLTEVTCLSDPEEEKKLSSGTYREEIASYLEEGIVNYLQDKFTQTKRGGS